MSTVVNEAGIAADVPIWRRPVCQSDVKAASIFRARALSRLGRCETCGALCDGIHSAHNLPLYCDKHCPACHPAGAVEA